MFCVVTTNETFVGVDMMVFRIDTFVCVALAVVAVSVGYKATRVAEISVSMFHTTGRAGIQIARTVAMGVLGFCAGSSKRIVVEVTASVGGDGVVGIITIINTIVTITDFHTQWILCAFTVIIKCLIVDVYCADSGKRIGGASVNM